MTALAFAAAGVGAIFALGAYARRRPDYDFAGRTVLITGGSRGLGLVLARQLASEGCRIAITARDADDLDRARQDLETRGAEVFARACDITDRAQVEALVSTIEQEFGHVDVLVNNAGVIEVGPLEVMTLEDFEEAMRTHFWGPLYTTMAVLPSMRERGEGRIVNISSIGGKIGVPHLTPYCASKFALVGLSESLRAELMKDGIVVTTVCPGLMRTGSPRNATFKGQHRLEYAWFSIGDSLPVTSMDADRAAEQIVDGVRRGDAEVILSVQAVLAIKFHSLFPEISSELAALANRLLPGPGGIGTERARGADSESALAPSVLTKLSDEAALRNNEVAEAS